MVALSQMAAVSAPAVWMRGCVVVVVCLCVLVYGGGRGRGHGLGDGSECSRRRVLLVLVP